MKPHAFDPAKGAGRSLVPDTHLAWVTHYFYKSNEEFLWKFSRSRGDADFSAAAEFPALTREFLEGFLQSAERSEENQPRSRFDDRRDAEIARLKALPGITQAQRAIYAYYDKNYPLLLQGAQASASLQDAGKFGRSFMEPLLEPARQDS